MMLQTRFAGGGGIYASFDGVSWNVDREPDSHRPHQPYQPVGRPATTSRPMVGFRRSAQAGQSTQTRHHTNDLPRTPILRNPKHLRPDQRDDSLIALIGWMNFDVDDATVYNETGRFFTIALHELGHVLGLGTNWNSLGLNSDFCGEAPTYTGANAVAEWPGLGITFAGTPIPIEDEGTCNGGTRDVHWRESVLSNELMTGFVEAAGVTMPLSAITVASLADMGFTVDLAEADPFVFALRAAAPIGSKERIEEIVRPARWLVDLDGTIRPAP